MSSDALPDDPGTLKAMLLAERMQNERLRQIIKELQRHRFGRRAESLPEDQMLLGLEDVEQSLAGDDAAKPMTPAERSARAERRRSNRGSLPAHLPRVEQIVDIDDKTCPCCQRELHCIGEDRSERLDMAPARSTRPADRWRIADRRDSGPGSRRQIRRPSSVVSPGANLRAAGHQSRPLNAGRLGWSCRLAPAPTARTPARKAEAKAEAVCRRDDGAGA